MVGMGPGDAWAPPVVATSATKEEGIDEMWDAVQAHRAHLEDNGGLQLKRRARLFREVEEKGGEMTT